MYINTEKCLKCGLCIPFCPMKCIVREDKVVKIIEDECVECEVCRNLKVCPADALTMRSLEWPRILRNQFSNPLVPHPGTGVPGRGTEEMKTNDVTGRFKRGRAGVAIEVGRPGTGTRLSEVEKIIMALVPYVKAFEPCNPVTELIIDAEGHMKPEVLNEKVLSAIIEFEIDQPEIVSVLKVLDEVKGKINTVFSLDLSCRLEPDGSCPAAILAREAGYTLSLNGKTNVGLGKPAAKED